MVEIVIDKKRISQIGIMKVLHINCNYLGTTLHQLLVRQLETKGIINKVFVPVNSRTRSVIEPDRNVIVRNCFNKRDRVCFYYKQKKIINTIEKNIECLNYDLIHAHTLFTDGNCALYLSKKYKIPYIVTVRNTDINDFFKHRPLLRKRGLEILENASYIIFLSDSYKKELVAKYIPIKMRDKIIQKSLIIPNGIDNFWLNNKYFSRDYMLTNNHFGNKKIKIIYAGSVDRNKNIGLTIKAIRILIGEGWDVSLTIAGGINDKTLFKKINSFKEVKYVGKLKKEDLMDYYRKADIFVMPSHKESFGLVYAEAMSQGLPVIYSRGQGFDQQFEEGLVGLSVDSYNAKELSEAIKVIIHNYYNISQNCIRLVDRFDWKEIAESYIDIYNVLKA